MSTTTTTTTTTTTALIAAAREAGAGITGFAVDPDLPRKRPSLTHYLMVIPPVVLFTVFIVVPAIQGAFYSFTNYAGYGAWHWIGLANYKAMFQDPAIKKAYGFTFLFGVVTTILVNVVALFGRPTQRQDRWPNWWRGVYFVPMVLSGWSWRSASSTCSTSRFLSSSTGDRWGRACSAMRRGLDRVVFVTAWIAFPSAVIIYLAGLSTIGSEIYEVSNSTAPRRKRSSVASPCCWRRSSSSTPSWDSKASSAPTTSSSVPPGGPAGATTSISMSIVNTVNNSDFAYGSAQAMVFFLVTIVLEAVIGLIPALLIRRIIDDAIPQKDGGMVTTLALVMVAIAFAVGSLVVLVPLYFILAMSLKTGANSDAGAASPSRSTRLQTTPRRGRW
jgi:raffinose/stachyose/melibiose transport system permease protein